MSIKYSKSEHPLSNYYTDVTIIFLLFIRGHKIYLSSAPNYDFVQFRALVQDITQDFKRISEEIIKIECQLRHMAPELSVHVAHVQDYEKQQLELVLFNL